MPLAAADGVARVRADAGSSSASASHARPMGLAARARSSRGLGARLRRERRRARSGSATCGCSGCSRAVRRRDDGIELERLMALADRHLRRRARASSRPSGWTARRSRCSAPSLVLLTQTIDQDAGDRGDRLEHARPARRDDADGQADRDRPASTRGSRSAPASSRAAGRCAVVALARRPRPRCCRRSWTTSRRCC